MWNRDAAEVIPIVEDENTLTSPSVPLGAPDNTINANDINDIQYDATRVLLTIPNIVPEREESASELQRHGTVSIASHDETQTVLG